MRIKNTMLAAGVLAMTCTGVFAQRFNTDRWSPLQNNDSFEVNLPHRVTVGHSVLEPGVYRAELLSIAGGDSPVLVITAKDNAKVNIVARVAPTFTRSAPAETQVTFHHIGDHYYFDRIYVQGLNYGFKFDLPKGLRKQAGI
jgi:hypothetical protein